MSQASPAAMMASMTPASVQSREIATLARCHGRAVFEAAYRILGNRAAAEDVQQDVFLKLMHRRPGLVESWPAYLCAAATRLAIDRLRRERRWRQLRPLWLATTPTAAVSAEYASIQHQRAQRLRAALATLPSKPAHCFALRYFHSFDLDAIAAQLGITENDVSVSLHRAVRSLRSTMSDWPDSTETTL